MTLTAERSTRRLPGPACSVGLVLAALPVAEATELVDLLAAGTNRPALSVLLAKRGHTVSPFSLGWHTRGQCSCGRR